MTSYPIEGVLPVLHVSYLADGRIDLDDLARELDWVYQHGAQGCCLAMVSDLFRLTISERYDLVEQVIRLNANRGAAIVSVGAESTEQAVAHARQARDAGAHAVMALPPVNTRTDDAGAHAYFDGLLQAVEIPLIIQDASGYVGRPLSLEMQLRLLERYGSERLLFKPETVPVGPTVTALVQSSGGKAKIFEGSGGMYLVETFRRGLRGVMPGCDLIDGIVALWKALQSGDDKRIYLLAFPISAIIAIQAQAGLDGFMMIERYIMRKRGVFRSSHDRGPVGFAPDSFVLAEVDRLLEVLQQALEASK